MPISVAWRPQPAGHDPYGQVDARPPAALEHQARPQAPGDPAALADISPEARAAAVKAAEDERPRILGERKAPNPANPEPEDTKNEAGEAAGEPTKPNGEKLSADEAQLIKELKARDREVRAHEAAHLAAAGGMAKGGPSYSMQAGPDGRQYAVGGEVQIDTSPGKSPEETVAKARRIQAAAHAPAQPSGQDRAVAAAAAQMAAEAERELAKVKKEDGQQDKAAEGEGEKMPAEPASGQPGPEAARTEAAKTEDGGVRPKPAGSDGPPESGIPAKAAAADPHDHPPAGCPPCLSRITRRLATYA